MNKNAILLSLLGTAFFSSHAAADVTAIRSSLLHFINDPAKLNTCLMPTSTSKTVC